MTSLPRGMGAYLLTCFGLTWAIQLGALAAGVRFEAPGDVGTLVLAIAMLAPAVSALFVLRFVTREGFEQAGLRWPGARALLRAWSLVLGALILSYGVSALTGLLRFDVTHLTGSSNAGGLQSPAALALLSFVSAATINPLVTSLFTLGEELGWTGFMLPKLIQHGPIRAALLYGSVWGVWHAPAIWGGHNFPDHPALGIVWMVGLCIALALFQTGLWLRTRSVLVTAFAHACVNSFAGAAELVSVDVQRLLGGATGLTSMAAFSALGLWLIYQHETLPSQSSVVAKAA